VLLPRATLGQKFLEPFHPDSAVVMSTFFHQLFGQWLGIGEEMSIIVGTED
jgi:hypothetical protein